MDIAALVIAIIVILAIAVINVVKPYIKIGQWTLNFYWLFALIGALVLLCGTFLPWDIFVKQLFSDTGMNPLKILILFLSMTCISIFLDELGFFSHLASFVLKKVKSSQIKIFISFFC